MTTIAVIGAGNSGLATAAHLLSEGSPVRLWNRSAGPALPAIRSAEGVAATGVVDGLFMPESLTTDMGEALDGTHLAIVTVPASGHTDVARAMAPHLRPGQTVVLCPGRTFGALAFARELAAGGSRADVTVAETQTILYTCRAVSPSAVAVHALKNVVRLAALDPSRTEAVIDALPRCIKSRVRPARSTLETGLGNVGMVLHCGPVLLNVGWIETPTTQFRHYYDGITPAVARLLERIDAERVAVARGCGVDTPTTAEWLQTSYGLPPGDIYTCIRANEAYSTIDAPRTLDHRYVHEDVPTGLVPLEALGRAVGVPVPTVTMLIDMLGLLTETDWRARGRGAASLGLSDSMPLDQVLTALTFSPAAGAPAGGPP